MSALYQKFIYIIFQDMALSNGLRPFWKVHFKPIQILNIIKDFLAAPKTIVGTFHFHVIDMCICLKKTLSIKILEELRFLSRRIHLVRKIDALNQTMKAQPVTMIANSEINENYIIFSDSFLVVPAGFVKNQLPPYHFLKILLSLQKRGRRIGSYVNL